MKQSRLPFIFALFVVMTTMLLSACSGNNTAERPSDNVDVARNEGVIYVTAHPFMVGTIYRRVNITEGVDIEISQRLTGEWVFNIIEKVPGCTNGQCEKLTTGTKDSPVLLTDIKMNDSKVADMVITIGPGPMPDGSWRAAIRYYEKK